MRGAQHHSFKHTKHSALTRIRPSCPTNRDQVPTWKKYIIFLNRIEEKWRICLGENEEGSASSLYYKEGMGFLYQKAERKCKFPNGFLMLKLYHTLLVTVNIYISIFIYVYQKRKNNL